MRDPRLARLADVLVNYSVGVAKDQVVRISGPPVGRPLIVELYRQVIAAGGHPVVRMAPEELEEIFLKHASDAQLAFVNPIHKFEYDRIDASIAIWGEENTKALSKTASTAPSAAACPPPTTAARSTADASRSATARSSMRRPTRASRSSSPCSTPTPAAASSASAPSAPTTTSPATRRIRCSTK